MDYPTVLAVLGGVAGLCLIVHLYLRGEKYKRDLTHAEHMKMLEAGQELDEINCAWAAVEIHRFWTLGAGGMTLSLGVIVAAVVGTVQLCAGHESYPTGLLILMWIVCTLISLLAMFFGLASLYPRLPLPPMNDEVEPPPPALPEEQPPLRAKWRKKR